MMVSADKPIRSIVCIGAGYVGGPTCAVIASQAPAIKVTVVDLDAARIAAWMSNDLPIYEPGLLPVVQLARDGLDGRQPNLFFSTDIDSAIDAADIIFVAVNTPPKSVGLGAGRASDLTYLESAVRRIAEVARSDKIIVEKSTVPCRTAAAISSILSALGRKNVQFDVLSNPEFLAEGSAMQDLLRPDRVLIGSEDTPAGYAASQQLMSVYEHWVPAKNIITMGSASSELAKLAANAFLAQRISSINALSAVCEATGADIGQVAYAIGLDRRIGPKMLQASVGFGGSCFKKDVLSLVWLAQTLHLPEVAAYWESVVIMNEWQTNRFSRRIISCMNNTLKHKTIAILGFAYKKNTGDTRMSPAITLVGELLAEEATITIHDPQVRPAQINQDLAAVTKQHPRGLDSVKICKDPYEACAGAHAVVVLTEWDAYKLKPKVDATDLQNGHTEATKVNGTSNEGLKPGELGTTAESGTSTPSTGLQWDKVRTGMKDPAYVFDGRNILDVSAMESLGFRIESIGR